MPVLQMPLQAISEKGLSGVLARKAASTHGMVPTIFQLNAGEIFSEKTFIAQKGMFRKEAEFAANVQGLQGAEREDFIDNFRMAKAKEHAGNVAFASLIAKPTARAVRGSAEITLGEQLFQRAHESLNRGEIRKASNQLGLVVENFKKAQELNPNFKDKLSSVSQRIDAISNDIKLNQHLFANNLEVGTIIHIGNDQFVKITSRSLNEKTGEGEIVGEIINSQGKASFITKSGERTSTITHRIQKTHELESSFELSDIARLVDVDLVYSPDSSTSAHTKTVVKGDKTTIELDGTLSSRDLLEKTGFVEKAENPMISEPKDGDKALFASADFPTAVGKFTDGKIAELRKRFTNDRSITQTDIPSFDKKEMVTLTEHKRDVSKIVHDVFLAGDKADPIGSKELSKIEEGIAKYKDKTGEADVQKLKQYEEAKDLFKFLDFLKTEMREYGRTSDDPKAKDYQNYDFDKDRFKQVFAGKVFLDTMNAFIENQNGTANIKAFDIVSADTGIGKTDLAAALSVWMHKKTNGKTKILLNVPETMVDKLMEHGMFRNLVKEGVVRRVNEGGEVSLKEGINIASFKESQMLVERNQLDKTVFEINDETDNFGRAADLVRGMDHLRGLVQNTRSENPYVREAAKKELKEFEVFQEMDVLKASIIDKMVSDSNGKKELVFETNKDGINVLRSERRKGEQLSPQEYFDAQYQKQSQKLKTELKNSGRYEEVDFNNLVEAKAEKVIESLVQTIINRDNPIYGLDSSALGFHMKSNNRFSNLGTIPGDSFMGRAIVAYEMSKGNKNLHSEHYQRAFLSKSMDPISSADVHRRVGGAIGMTATAESMRLSAEMQGARIFSAEKEAGLPEKLKLLFDFRPAADKNPAEPIVELIYEKLASKQFSSADNKKALVTLLSIHNARGFEMTEQRAIESAKVQNSGVKRYGDYENAFEMKEMKVLDSDTGQVRTVLFKDSKGGSKIVVFVGEDGSGNPNKAHVEVAENLVKKVQTGELDKEVAIVHLGLSGGSNILGKINADSGIMANTIFIGSTARAEALQFVNRADTTPEQKIKRLPINEAELIVAVHNDPNVNFALRDAARAADNTGDATAKKLIAETILDNLEVHDQVGKVYAMRKSQGFSEAQVNSRVGQYIHDVTTKRLQGIADRMQQVKLVGRELGVSSTTGQKPIVYNDVSLAPGQWQQLSNNLNSVQGFNADEQNVQSVILRDDLDDIYVVNQGGGVVAYVPKALISSDDLSEIELKKVNDIKAIPFHQVEKVNQVIRTSDVAQLSVQSDYQLTQGQLQQLSLNLNAIGDYSYASTIVLRDDLDVNKIFTETDHNGRTVLHAPRTLATQALEADQIASFYQPSQERVSMPTTQDRLEMALPGVRVDEFKSPLDNGKGFEIYEILDRDNLGQVTSLRSDGIEVTEAFDMYGVTVNAGERVISDIANNITLIYPTAEYESNRETAKPKAVIRVRPVNDDKENPEYKNFRSEIDENGRFTDFVNDDYGSGIRIKEVVKQFIPKEEPQSIEYVLEGLSEQFKEHGIDVSSYTADKQGIITVRVDKNNYDQLFRMTGPDDTHFNEGFVARVQNFQNAKIAEQNKPIVSNTQETDAQRREMQEAMDKALEMVLKMEKRLTNYQPNADTSPQQIAQWQGQLSKLRATRSLLERMMNQGDTSVNHFFNPVTGKELEELNEKFYDLLINWDQSSYFSETSKSEQQQVQLAREYFTENNIPLNNALVNRLKHQMRGRHAAAHSGSGGMTLDGQTRNESNIYTTLDIDAIDDFLRQAGLNHKTGSNADRIEKMAYTIIHETQGLATKQGHYGHVNDLKFWEQHSGRIGVGNQDASDYRSAEI
ncbi:MAG: hypothetical protein KC618_01300, partial [Candidatus Omnitrophica bacterium]|nr:hypothetical protein [Candidatus Omnitrophota bacterium]